MIDEKTGRKSSYSGGDNNCVEVGTFRKSSYSNKPQGNCVNVGTGPDRVVGLRDTKLEDNTTGQYHGPTVEVPGTAWRSFTRRIRSI